VIFLKGNSFSGEKSEKGTGLVVIISIKEKRGVFYSRGTRERGLSKVVFFPCQRKDRQDDSTNESVAESSRKKKKKGLLSSRGKE